MTVHQPPRVAMWLLERLGTGAVRDAIAGDLFEDYQRRRSATWYWRQAITAILLGAWRDLRGHWAVAAGAIGMGQMLISVPAAVLIDHPASWFANVGLEPSVGALAARAALVAAAFLSGWLVSRVFRAHRAVALLSLALAMLAEIAAILPDVADVPPLALALIAGFYPLTIVIGGLVPGPAPAPRRT